MMKIKEIKYYIIEGSFRDFSLELDIPKQADNLWIDTNGYYSEGEVQSLLGTTARVAGKQGPHKFPWICYLAFCEYPHLPYHFIDEEGTTYQIVSRYEMKCGKKRIPFSSVPKHLKVVKISDIMRDIIGYWRPMNTKRTDSSLGRAFRYNKLLLYNGFEPEDFNWIGRSDFIKMIDLEDGLSLSEIKWWIGSPGDTFIRNGRDRYIKDRDGNLILLDTGEKARYELGYRKE